nr:hypothetical protein [Micromonospora sp. AMSO31t]
MTARTVAWMTGSRGLNRSVSHAVSTQTHQAAINRTAVWAAPRTVRSPASPAESLESMKM